LMQITVKRTNILAQAGGAARKTANFIPTRLRQPGVP